MSRLLSGTCGLVLLLSTTVFATPYFLHPKTSWETFFAATTLPGTDLTGKNLLRLVTHNALLDAFFINKPLAPIEKLSLLTQEAREQLQHLSYLELLQAVLLVKDAHLAKFNTYSDSDDPHLRLHHLWQITDIDNLYIGLSSVAERRLAYIDFLLSKTDEAEQERGSYVLPSILYAIIVDAMPPVVRKHELASAFVSTTETWYLRDSQGNPITDLGDEAIEHATLSTHTQAQLDALLTRARQALEFIIAQHAETKKDGYWHRSTEADRQAYEDFAAQALPAQQQTLVEIKQIQAQTNAAQRQNATIEFLLGYVPEQQ